MGSFPETDNDVWVQFMWRKHIPGRRITRLPELTWAEPAFPIFPYQTWRTVFSRSKKLTRLEG